MPSVFLSHSELSAEAASVTGFNFLPNLDGIPCLPLLHARMMGELPHPSSSFVLRTQTLVFTFALASELPAH